MRRLSALCPKTPTPTPSQLMTALWLKVDMQLCGASMVLLSEPNYCVLQRGDFTGATVWDASICFSQWLATSLPADFFHNKRVLELGAGRGVVSFALQRLGAREVCVTDGEKVAIPWHRTNGSLNEVLWRRATQCGEGAEKPGLPPLRCEQLIWGDASTMAEIQRHEAFDVVVGCDLIYVAAEIIPSLIETAVALTAEGGTLLFAFMDREGRPGQAAFIEMVAERWPTNHAWMDVSGLPEPYRLDKFRVMRIEL